MEQAGAGIGKGVNGEILDLEIRVAKISPGPFATSAFACCANADRSNGLRTNDGCTFLGVIMDHKQHTIDLPASQARDSEDHAQLRHGRDRDLGFSVGRYLQPAPMLFSRDGHNIFLGDTFRGATAFLVCAGPSLKSHDLTKLEQRGILTCAVNNAATIVRPNLWVSVDDPGNFCDAIWRDPAIWKFVPLCHMEKPFSVRTDDGQLVASQEKVGDMPTVFGYRRNEAFNAEQWLHEDTFNWGNHSERVDAYGIQGSRSVMLVALRLLFYLGVRRVNLIGCDFQMTYGNHNYAFDQDRSRASVNGNNSSYAALNVRLEHLKPHFDEEGFEVFNCTPVSGLRAFPKHDYEQAIDEALEAYPKTLDTAGMYDRKVKSTSAAHQSIAEHREVISSSLNLVDPVESFDLPDITLVTAIDQCNLDIFRWTWRTWTRFRTAMSRMPLLLIHDPQEGIRDELQSIVQGHNDVRFAAASPSRLGAGRDRWSHAYICTVAETVTTPWYLRLEPEAVACRFEPWLRPEWFRPNEQGRSFVFASHAWGYTKPADALAQLDDWADGIRGLQQHEPLRIPFDSREPHLRHAAISSWIFLGNTEWTKELVEYAPAQLPCGSHDTFTLYCALRRRDPFIRCQMKSLGWDHSFNRTWSAVERCHSILNASGTRPAAEISH